MAQLMSQTEYAAHRGVGKSAVSNWKAQGLLVFAEDPERPGKQLVDVAKSDLVVGGTIDPTRGRPRSGEAGLVEAVADAPAVQRPMQLSGMDAARLDEMLERTRRRKIETAQLLGGLVSVAEYERRAGDMGRMIRERTQALIRQHAERVAAESDPRQVMAVLAEAFDGLFDQLAGEIEAAVSQEREVDAQLAPLADDEDADEDPAA